MMKTWLSDLKLLRVPFSIAVTIIFSVCLLPLQLQAQLPEVTNYSNDDYTGHPTNYAIIEDDSGLIYVANAYSILEFDGITWRSISTNNISPSAFTKDKSGKIYVGLYSDIGYLEKDARGETKFVSLANKIQESDIKKHRITQVKVHKGKVYYCSINLIYVYDGKTVSLIPAPHFEDGSQGVFECLNTIEDELFVFDDVHGLEKIEGNSLLPKGHPEVKGWLVNFFKFQNRILLVTSRGLSYLNDGQSNLIPIKFQGEKIEVKILHATPLSNNRIALGTKDAGILICDHQGNVLRSFNKSSGFQSQEINFLFLDSKGNLWSALNNGISVMQPHAPIEYFSELQGLEGMGYSSALFNDTLYLGTSQALFYSPNWSLHQHSTFNPVDSTKGLIHQMRVANGKLLASDVGEFYQIDGTKANKISPDTWNSTWTFRKIPNNDSLILCGTYYNLRVFAYRKGKWVYRNTIEGFEESARMFEFDENGTVWLVQGLAGLFRIELDTDFRKVVSVTNYVDKYSFKPDHFNDVVKIENQLKIATYDGIFTLNTKDELLADSSFSALPFVPNRIRKIENTKDELYLIDNDRPIFIQLENGRYKVKPNTPANLRDKLVGSAEHISKLDENNYLIATQKGFALFHSNIQRQEAIPQCLIREVKTVHTEQDTVFLFGTNTSFKASFEQKHLAFHFALPLFGSYKNILYHTEILTADGNKILYKSATKNHFKEYTNLNEGNYIFRVWADVNGKKNQPVAVTFTILPPWYRTLWAKTLFLIALIGLGLTIIWFIHHRFQQQAFKLENKRLKEIKDKELRHRAEILELELQSKNEEMAFLALQVSEKKKFLGELTEELTSFSSRIKDDSDKSEFRKLIRSIHLDERDEENWSNFQMHFDKNSDNFFQKLKELDPKMNESNLLMCSYIKMGKSNKEIAELLHISTSAVEKRKYRLKEKLKLEGEISVTEFIASL